MYRIVIIFFLLISSKSLAQNFVSWQYNDRYFSAYFGTGPTSYRGDLKHNNGIQEELSHFLIGAEARLWSKVSARIETGFYNIRGNDKFAADSSYFRQRNLSFSSSNFEFSLQGVFYLRKYAGDYYKRWAIDPYLAGGIGFTTIAPRAQYQEQEVKLRPLQTENVSYAPIGLIFPVAAGIKFRINEFINLNTEFAYRFSTSDYLDDVSTIYPATFQSELAENLSNRKDEIPIINQEAYDNLVAGQSRGDSSTKDSYFFMSIRLEIFLPSGSNAVVKKPAAY